MRKMFAICVAAAALVSCGLKQESMKELTDRVFDRAVHQLILMDSNLGEKEFPRSIDSEGNLVKSDSKWWCCGFYPGSLWYTYEYTGNEEIKSLADKYTRSLLIDEVRKDHDLGFIIWCSFGNAFRLTGDETYKPMIEAGARILAARYSPVTKTIRSWNYPLEYQVIIDNMMNLELLEEASTMFCCDSLADIARTHANTTMENHFRDDYTSYHLVCYDMNDGSVVRKQTVQGYADDSAWARGQAWALYGYTMMYRETGDENYLNQAVNVGDMIAGYLPEDGVAYWDFNDPAIPDTYRDASAAAVMASAYIELSGYVDSGKQKKEYLKIAETILRTLASEEYLCAEDECHGFLLKHSVGHLPKKSEVDVPLTYADYYFLEALLRYKNIE